MILPLLAQATAASVRLDPLDVGIAGAVFAVISFFVKLGDRLWKPRNGNGNGDGKSKEFPAPPCTTADGQNIICSQQHQLIKGVVENIASDQQRVFTHLAATMDEFGRGLNEFRSMVQRSHQAIELRQEKIVNEVQANREIVMRSIAELRKDIT